MSPDLLIIAVLYDPLRMDNVAGVPEGPAPAAHARRLDLGKGADLWVAGAGERLLILHGWGLHPHVFRPALERLAHRGFEVAAPGLAVVGRRWDVGRAVHRVRKTLEFLEWDAATVVGYSLGGAVAAAFAAAAPARVRLLALVNSVGLRMDRGVLAWAAPFARYARASNLPAVRAFGMNALRVRGLQNLADAALYAREAHLEGEFARIRSSGLPSLVLFARELELMLRAAAPPRRRRRQRTPASARRTSGQAMTEA
jgi:pimeloyl-ACP methyl ester carboxylesterase